MLANQKPRVYEMRISIGPLNWVCRYRCQSSIVSERIFYLHEAFAMMRLPGDDLD